LVEIIQRYPDDKCVQEIAFTTLWGTLVATPTDHREAAVLNTRPVPVLLDRITSKTPIVCYCATGALALAVNALRPTELARFDVSATMRTLLGLSKMHPIQPTKEAALAAVRGLLEARVWIDAAVQREVVDVLLLHLQHPHVPYSLASQAAAALMASPAVTGQWSAAQLSKLLSLETCLSDTSLKE
jgi:hypothetical protein